LKLQVESISRQIRGWTNTLQNTKIQGQRYLNDNSRRAYEKEKDRLEFQESLKKHWQIKATRKEQ
jgi:hypothetical protein